MSILNHKKTLGFTLIELLVVISIIGVLSSVVMVGLQSARERARGAKMVMEMNQLKTAFELYKNTFGKYPEEDVNKFHVSIGSCWSWIHGDLGEFLKTNLVDNKYISLIPEFIYKSAGLPCDGSMYMTGSDRYLYYIDNVSDFYLTCGGRKLKGYYLSFYSDLKLDFPHAGYNEKNIDYSKEYFFTSGGDNTNWYCIGE